MIPTPQEEYLTRLTRRELFQRAGIGITGAALATLLSEDLGAAPRGGDSPLAPKSPHITPRARNVIFIHLVGAPSQLDLFDHKPALQKHDGQLCPKELIEGKRFAFIRGHPKLLGTRYEFQRHGRSGIEISELLPHLAQVVDDVALIKTLHTEQFNHGPAQLFFQTGFERFGRPPLGSWVSYGLGSENRNLPSFVALITGDVAGAGNSLWGSGFLPTTYQGIEFRTQGQPVHFLSNPGGILPADRRRIVESINRLNTEQLLDTGDPEIATRISQYEMAFRMQASVPELVDISREPVRVHEMYGTQPGKVSFANNCLLARRLVERGVRFVQLFDSGWDHHDEVFTRLPKKCKEVDQPIAALIRDLKERGLLDDTLVIWGAEFGRTPVLQNDYSKAGRDHHNETFCVWMAGGGVQGGIVHGKTDDLGYFSTEDPVHINDFHATILHLLGIEHTKLTYKFQGRHFRLTDVGGHVVHKLLA